jgi:predicted ATPase
MSETIINYGIFKHGSVWLKADFHLHTRADKQFQYSGEDNSFLKDYVAKLKEESISIGVITNHNKFDKNEFINLRKKAAKEEIFLLPGVELSVNDGSNVIHTLVVFSYKWLEAGQDYINQFLNVAFAGKTPAEYENENGRCSLGLIDTIKTLDRYNRDYFFVFAHVEQNSGLWKEVEGGRLEELGKEVIFQNRTLGFQKVRTHDVPDRKCRKKVKNWLNNWYPAEVEGCDCKSINEIGSKDGETWLKIGDFTFESVKYALVDHANRVKPCRPEPYKHSHIKSIFLEGETLKGKTISFSPELNTLIGIRGSGKSTILEAVRYVLDIPFGENALKSEVEYRDGLVYHTLGSGGKAVITAVDQYGSEFKIKRILNELPEVYIDDKLQPGVSIRKTIIKNPIYFGQKDLSSSGEGFEKDLVEKLVGESLYKIRGQVEEKKQAVAEIVGRLQNLTDIDEKINDYTQKKLDAEFNLKKYEEYGIEEKFRKQTDFDRDERKIKQILTDIDEYRNDLDSFISQYEDSIKNNQAYSSNQNQDFFEPFLEEYNKIINILEKHKSDSREIGGILKTLRLKSEQFISFKKEFSDDFAKVRRMIEKDLKEKGAAALNLEEYPALKRTIDNSTKMLDALNKQKSRATEIKNDLLDALTDLNNLWHDEFLEINNHLEKINNKQSSLKIEVEFKGDKTGFLDYMKNVFRGSKIRENTFLTLVSEYPDFSAMYSDFESAKKKAGSSPETFEKYFFENLQNLLTYHVENKFTIKYRGKELKHHSLGQRSSALILFVLNQHDNDVIIIDQPEDDLDNQTIYEDVIKLIRELKPGTQFIFATHNANFPVLGDAEQIHSCIYEDDEIMVNSGSIDSPVLQKEIVDIMEGGEDAFNKRKEIYGIWKPLNS